MRILPWAGDLVMPADVAAVLPRDTCDSFHLYVTAGKHALESSIYAQKLLWLWRRMEHFFALGQGRHMDRCVASFLGQKYLVCKTPAGNRNWGYMISVAERYLVKLPNYFFAMLIKYRHALQGRGSHSFAWMKEQSAALCDLSLFTWALAFHVGQQVCCKDLVQMLQDPADLPWTRHRAVKKNHRQIVEFANALGWWRRRLHSLLYLRGYLSQRCLRRYWWVLCSAPGGLGVCDRSKGIHLGAQLLETLLSGQYKGCAFAAGCLELPPETHLVTPACQCGHRPQTKPGLAILCYGGLSLRHQGDCALDGCKGYGCNSLARVGIRCIRFTHDLLERGRMRFMPNLPDPAAVAGHRNVKVPWWVSRTLYNKDQMKERPPPPLAGESLVAPININCIRLGCSSWADTFLLYASSCRRVRRSPANWVRLGCSSGVDTFLLFAVARLPCPQHLWLSTCG